MDDVDDAETEATRLERLWSGDFGDEYVDRNLDAYAKRGGFWTDFLATVDVRRVLEVGCNVGGNLRWVRQQLPEAEVHGIDVNRKALTVLRQEVPDVEALCGPARELPYRDRWFDLVYTFGVLIHQPPTTLPLVMAEMARCSARYVLFGEYFSPDDVEVPYRGNEGALFKRDFGAYYRELFPEHSLVRTGVLGPDEGWDDITWWLFERR